MKDLSYLPQGYEGLQIVHSTEDFLSYEFNRESMVNVVVFPRELNGDFDGLSRKISSHFNTKTWVCDDNWRDPTEKLDQLAELRESGLLTPPEEKALTLVMQDYKLLKPLGHNLTLTDGTMYGGGDVSEWHVDPDKSDIPSDITQCFYTTIATQFLENDNATYRGKHWSYLYYQNEDTEHWQPQCGDLIRHLAHNDDFIQGAIHRRDVKTICEFSVPRLGLGPAR